MRAVGGVHTASVASVAGSERCQQAESGMMLCVMPVCLCAMPVCACVLCLCAPVRYACVCL